MLKILKYLAGFFLIFFIYVKILEHTSIFYPYKKIEATPALINLEFKDIYIDSGDKIKINGWFIPAKSSKFTILFLHGNAGNIGHRLDKIAMLNSLGFNVFIIDWRGYGKSQGRPSEKGFYRDATAAYMYLQSNFGVKEEEIIVYGESLGSAAAIELAVTRFPRAIIAEMAFSSIRDMAKELFPFIPSFFVSDTFNSFFRIKRARCAKLFINSPDDEIVPLKLAKKLFNEAPQPKEFNEIRGSHNSAFFDSKDSYLGGIKAFTDRL